MKLPTRKATKEAAAIRRQPKHGMEPGIVVPIRRTGDPVAQSAHSYEEKVHGEACPDKQAGLTIAPHLTDAVVDDIRNWKNEQSARQVNGTNSYLLGLEDVCQDEADTKENAEEHEKYAHLSTRLFCHILFC